MLGASELICILYVMAVAGLGAYGLAKTNPWCYVASVILLIFGWPTVLILTSP